MASFGSFETVREVYFAPSYAVYSARKMGDSVGEYALKVFRLPGSELEAELAGHTVDRAEVERARLSSLIVQERTAASSRFIAPVLERGNNDKVVWYATRLYPRSVNKLLNSKVALPRASLEHIIRSVAMGALDLRRACGRSHGDIRPTNIQIDKFGQLNEAAVVLSDPLPGGTNEARQYECNDLRSIGLILLQLVRQRVLSVEDVARMLPIGPSAEWTRAFGRDAKNWLALCNRLLDPNLSPENFRLEDLLTRLDELKPKKRSWSRLAAAGAGALVIALVLGYWSMRPQPGTVEITSEPTGATIIIDQAKPAGVTPVRLTLRRGNHVVEARLDQLGLPEEATNCVVERGLTARIHFRFGLGSIDIRSEPPGATVLRDGVEIGKIPMDGRPFNLPFVIPGLVRYQLKLDQYEPAVVVGVVSNLQKLELTARLHRPQPVKNIDTASVATDTAQPVSPPGNGVLELKTDPLPASIFDSEGRSLGRASPDFPLRLELAPGLYSLAAQADGLADVAAILKVESHRTNQHTFAFDFGAVDWTAPPAATVSSGGQTRAAPATFIQKPGVAVTYVIAAPGYQSITNDVTVVSGEHKGMVARLTLQMQSVELVSDPPGAEFFAQDGSALTVNETNKQIYYLAPGPADLVARHPTLGTLTNHLDLKPGQNASRTEFKFDYGTLVLTNLPSDLAVYEGETKVGSAADQRVYQKRGTHLYVLRGGANPATIQTDINPGLNYLTVVSVERSWKNSVGMWFAWVPNLPGGGTWPGQSEPGGWVGLTEVTQGQYKKMDGTNPSTYRDGGDNRPVENLTWEQAVTFCRWLSSADTAKQSGWQYSLPSDDQFAAFAGDADRVARVTNEGRTSSLSDDMFQLQRTPRIPTAASLGNSARTHPEPVASTRQPNQFGLYDVVGNVWEWLARSNGKDRFYAGGGYLNFSPRTVSAKARERALEKGPAIGLRVILVPSQ